MEGHTTVGREEQLELLCARLAQLDDHTGSAIALVGRPGMGKSHLLRAASQDAVRRGLRPVIGRATDTGNGEAYRPIVEAAARAIADATVSSPYHELITAMVGVAGPSARSVAPTALGEAMLTLCSGRLVVLEDLHWADADTLAVVEYLADHAVEAGVALMVSARDDTNDAMTMIRRATTRGSIDVVQVGPLDVHQTAKLTASIAGGTGARAARAVHRWSAGVPLIVTALASDAATLQAVVNGWPSAPATFSDIVGDRFDGLSESDRAVIATAALLGDDIDVRETALVTGLDQNAVVAALREAVAAGLVAADGARFDHALTRIALADRMLAFERSELAERALSVLPDIEPARRARLAHEAGRTGEAATLLAEAGRDAADVGALASAEELLRQSLALEEHGETRMRLVEVLVEAGKATEALLETDDLDGFDAGCRPRAVLARARALRDAGRTNDAVRLIAAAGAVGTVEERCELTLLSASIRLECGDAEGARSLLESVADDAPGADPAVDALPLHLRCEAKLVEGRAHRDLHQLHEARRSFQAALELAERNRSPHRMAAARFELGTIDFVETGPPDLLIQASADAIGAGALRLAAYADHLALIHGLEVLRPVQLEDRGDALAARCSRLGLRALERSLGAALTIWHALDRDRAGMEVWIERVIAGGDDDVWSALARNARAVYALLDEDRSVALEWFDRAERHYPERVMPENPWRHYGNVVRALEGRAVEVLDRTRKLPLAIATAADAVRAGARGDVTTANSDAARSITMVESAPVVRALLQRLLAEGGLRFGFGRPDSWLQDAIPVLGATRFDAVTAAAEHLAAGAPLEQGGVRLPSGFADRGVTAREFEVLELLVEGLSYAEIGARVHLSPRTVEGHVARVRAKFDDISRVELIVLTSEALGRAG